MSCDLCAISCDLCVLCHIQSNFGRNRVLSSSELQWGGCCSDKVSHSHTPILVPPLIPIRPFFSVIILAFVKSSGKEVNSKKGVSETTPLLSEPSDSLEGTLRDKVVGGYQLGVWLMSHTCPPVPQLQRDTGSPSNNIQTPSDTLTFSQPSAVRNAGMGAQEWDEDDDDYSWTDRLGVWPRRIMSV